MHEKFPFQRLGDKGGRIIWKRQECKALTLWLARRRKKRDSFGGVKDEGGNGNGR